MLKNRVAAGFSQASAQYDQYAVLQQMSASAMAEKICAIHPSLPSGPILEVGCGTGAVSKVLVAELSERDILLTDLSPGMVEICRQNLVNGGLPCDSVRWAVADGELLTDDVSVAFIVSALTMQWFQSLEQSFSQLIKKLIPGGVMLCSYVSNNSFPEWRQICLESNIPFNANPLPTEHFYDAIDFKNIEIDSRSSDIKVRFDSAKDFFKSLNKTGSGTSISDEFLSVAQLRKLIKAWDDKVGNEQVEVTYVVSYLFVRKLGL